jgi:hypothetical protein
VILPPPPKPPRPPLDLLTERFLTAPLLPSILDEDTFVNRCDSYPLPKDMLDRLRPLYQLLPLTLVHRVLHDTRRQSRRQRRLPAHNVVWLVVAQSLFCDRALPLVWRHLHAATDTPEPDDSAFTHARKRLGSEPLQQLFPLVVTPLGRPPLRAVYHRRWRVLALDGSILELPDSPANRRYFGAATNQHKAAAFPQLQLLALCEVGTHIVTDFAFGPYATSELELSQTLLPRLPAGVLLLLDRGLSYFEQIQLVRQQPRNQVLARVKSGQRTLLVEEVLSDGSYLSHIYASANDRRAGKEGLAVRVIRYTHDDLNRDGCGDETCLITTVLDPAELSAQEAVALYPWRWQEESTLLEVKGVLLKNQQPLLRSKTPVLVEQELYGLLLAHFLVRSVMVVAALFADVAATRLSFKHSQEIVEDYLMEKPGRRGQRRWLSRLVVEISQQTLRAPQWRSNPRVKKVTRCKWRGKKPTDRGRVHAQPFAKVSRIVPPPEPAAVPVRDPVVGQPPGEGTDRADRTSGS